MLNPVVCFPIRTKLHIAQGCRAQLPFRRQSRAPPIPPNPTGAGMHPSPLIMLSASVRKRKGGEETKGEPRNTLHLFSTFEGADMTGTTTRAPRLRGAPGLNPRIPYARARPHCMCLWMLRTCAKCSPFVSACRESIRLFSGAAHQEICRTSTASTKRDP